MYFMANGKKKQRPKPYTVTWYLELVPYAHVLCGWGVEKFAGYILLICISVMCWLFPTLKRRKDAKYYKNYGVGFWEYHYKEWRNNSLWMYFTGHDLASISFTLIIYFSLLVWLLDTLLYSTLGFSVLQEIHSTYEKLFLGILIAVAATIFLFSDYLEWDDRHVAYIEDFEVRFSAFQKFLIWLFGCLPVSGFLLWLLYNLLLIPK